MEFHDYFDSKVTRGVMFPAKGLTKKSISAGNAEMANDLPLAYGDEFRTRQIALVWLPTRPSSPLKGSITCPPPMSLPK